MSSNIKKIYSLTSMQEGMYFQQRLGEGKGQYSIILRARITGKIDAELFKKSLSFLTQKHEILRTAFVLSEKQNKVWQVILENREIEIYIYNESAIDIEDLQKQQIDRGFDLEKDSLLRVFLLKRGENEHELLWISHHIIMDGWCNSLLLRDFLNIYSMLVSGESDQRISDLISLENEKTCSYQQYVKWLQNKDQTTAMRYWKNLLCDYNEIPEFLNDAQGNNEIVIDNKVVHSFSKETTDRLMKIAANERVTLSNIMQMVWSVLVNKHTYCDDIVFGNVVSGRNIGLPGIEQMVGLMINTVPVRVRLEKDSTFIDIAKKLGRQVLESMEYEFCSLAEIQSLAGVGNRLIQSLFVCENYYFDESGVKKAQEVSGLEIELMDSREETNYPINFIVTEGESIGFELVYRSDVFTKEEISRIQEHIVKIVEIFVENPNAVISDCTILGQDEIKLVSGEFSVSERNTVLAESVIDVFERQAKNNPDKIAIYDEDNTYTYGELNSRVNMLADHFTKNGIGKESIIAMLIERSVQAIETILAAWKVGAAYVPMDSSQPKDRLNYIIEDSGAERLITNGISFESHIPTIDISKLDYSDLKDVNPVCDRKEGDLAYIIYTSGTTGRPKGVMVEHKGLMNLVSHSKEEYRVGENDRVLQFANLVFDASVWEITMGLFTESSLWIVPQSVIQELDEFSKYIKENHISVALLPPQYLEQIDNIENAFRLVITGGSEAIAENIKKLGENTVFYNAYGPTEATVVITDWKYNRGEIIPKRIPIGKPINNTKLFILNNNSLCGIKMPGELCVSGVGLARGYRNMEQFTAEKFEVFNGERIYHTGDLACWNKDGEIEFLGRIDQQVKIHGFRIELGEIETVLKNVEGINQAAVTTQVINGETYICAYYDGENAPSEDEIKKQLGTKLPEYMLPAFYMGVDSIPVNLSGKTNYKQLPKIQINSIEEYVAPETELEVKLAESYAEILGCERVSRNANFFTLGGHSIKAMLLVNAINKRIEGTVTINDVMGHPVLADLANNIRNKSETVYEYFSPADEKDKYAMSYQQKSVYLIWLSNKESLAYNIPMKLKLSKDFEPDKLEKAFQTFIDINEIFRTHLMMEGGECFQVICKNAEFKLEREETDDVEVSYRNFIRPFDLENDILLRAKYVKSENDNYLFMDIHHIISDGKTIGLLIEEIVNLYNGHTVEAKKLSYKDYSEWIVARDFSDEKEYYGQLLQGELHKLELPVTGDRNNTVTGKGIIKEFCINSDLCAEIREFAKKNQVTDFMVFTAALMILLGKLSNQEDVIIGSPVYGRTIPETEKMMGMFVNSVVLRGKPERRKTVIDFINEVKDNCLKAFEYQDYPLYKLYEDHDINSNASDELINVMIVMQNYEDFMPSLAEEGIEVEQDYRVDTKFDLNFDLKESDSKYHIELTYDNNLYSNQIIETLLEAYSLILETLIDEPDIHIGDISLAIDNNNIEIPKYIDEECLSGTVLDLFEKMVQKKGKQIAVIQGTQEITFEEFNSKINKMSNYLMGLGIKKGDIVPIIGERSIELMVGMYAVLKAGACYVPIDPMYPEDRINYILQDVDAKVVLVDAKGKDKYSDYDAVILAADTYESASETKPMVEITSDLLAYMIYTSGTTGSPKGVMINHGSLNNYVVWGSKQYFCDNYKEYMPLFTSISFDLTVTTIFIPIVTGNTVVIYSEDYAIDKIARDNRITIAKLTPSHLQMLKETSDNSCSIRKFILGGEQLLTKLSDEIIALYGDDSIIYNEYGPTEATVGCMIFAYTAKTKNTRNAVSIGTPISNVRLYVMQENTLCGIGQIGELCVAGPCLAEGYYKLPDNTKAAFVSNPYVPYEKMYRTGDMVRLISEDDMEYIGRKDEQIKIHGYRIEISEIENVLLQCEQVKNATVIVKEDMNQILCAFVVPEGQPTETTTKEILAEISKKLPRYMMPAHIEYLEEIPITINGKVDKRKVQSIPICIELKKRELSDNDVENKLAEIFEQILNIDSIGYEDDFLECGGDSIQAIRIITKCSEIGYELSLSDLMKYRTVRGVLPYVKTDIYAEREFFQKSFVGRIEPSPIMLKYKEKQSQAEELQLQKMLLESEEKLDIDKLEETMHILADYHDILRLRETEEEEYEIAEVGTEPAVLCTKVVIHNAGDFKSRIINECDKTQKEINLKTGNVIKVKLIESEQKSWLFVCAHHTVMDAVSWHILLGDFMEIYHGIDAENKPQLPLKTAPYGFWTSELKKYALSDDFSSDRKYWNKFANKVRNLGLGSEKVDVDNSILQYEFELDENKTENLISKFESTMNMSIRDVILIALSKAVYDWRFDEEILVNVEGHGRETMLSYPVDRTIGWFTSIYPVLLTYDEYNFVESILENKDRIHNVPNNGVGYGLSRYYCEDDVALEPEFVLNHFGTANNNNNGMFEVLDWDSDSSLNESNLWSPCTITTSIRAGRLIINIQAQSKNYSYNTLKEFAELLNESILYLEEYIRDNQKIEISVSDYDEEGWDNEELREVLGLYE